MSQLPSHLKRLPWTIQRNQPGKVDRKSWLIPARLIRSILSIELATSSFFTPMLEPAKLRGEQKTLRAPERLSCPQNIRIIYQEEQLCRCYSQKPLSGRLRCRIAWSCRRCRGTAPPA